MQRYRYLYAIRLIGGLPVKASSLVSIKSNTMTTVSGSLATAVPMCIFRERLFANPEGWQILYDDWDNIESPLIRLHQFFGGKDNLAALRDVVMDKGLKEQMSMTERGELKLDHLTAEILEYLDPTPEHITFRRYLCELTNEPIIALSLPSLGPWKTAAAAYSYGICNLCLMS